MATSTYRAVDAALFAKEMVKRMPTEDVQTRILNEISLMMWNAAPWRWTIAYFPAIVLASNDADYTVAIPADFVYLLDSYLSDSGSSAPRPLHIEPFLPTVITQVGQPVKIAIHGEPATSGTAYVYPKPPTITAGITQTIYSVYKKQPPILTEQTIYTAGSQLFDDTWFWVFTEGVLWRCYQYADDQRAGTAKIGANGQWEFSGQRAAFEAGLEMMRQREKIPLFNQSKTAPEQEALRK